MVKMEVHEFQGRKRREKKKKRKKSRRHIEASMMTPLVSSERS
jgi:hypothetical protein